MTKCYIRVTNLQWSDCEVDKTQCFINRWRFFKICLGPP